MALRALQTHLEDTFYPPAAIGLDAVLRLQIGKEQLLFEVSPLGLTFDDPDALAESSIVPDATFYFEDVDTAWALLSGRADAFEAFMQGRFRADGYLMWAFSLMAMFQSKSLPETPIE
jgi:putative sterol carrier protein